MPLCSERRSQSKARLSAFSFCPRLTQNVCGQRIRAQGAGLDTESHKCLRRCLTLFLPVSPGPQSRTPVIPVASGSFLCSRKG